MMTDIPFEQEIRIRRKVANIFNKRQEDFPSLKDYNDYLEEVEDMTFNLVEGKDADAIKEKIAKYEQDNYEQIINARARRAEELAASLMTSKGGSSIALNDINDGVQKLNPQGSIIGGTGQYAPSAVGGALMQPRPTGVVAQCQPKPVNCSVDAQNYSMDDDVMQKLRAERGGKAGGWSIELSKKRAHEEAFGCLWV